MQGASSQNTGSVGLEEDAVEQNNTGWRYLTGDGVQKDPREAAKWLLRAAQNGSPNAQCTLGVMCHEGVGVAQDDRQAVAWYRKSADQGFAQAQLNLGIMYNNGWGVSRNVAEAMKWFRLAARQGDETAIANLRALNVEW
jgi:TPR repeat protein